MIPNFLSTALQIGDKHRVTTPVNWKKGEDVIVHPTVTNDEAKTLFPEYSQHLVSINLDLIKGFRRQATDAFICYSPTSERLLSRWIKY